jgi:hypothetical protein
MSKINQYKIELVVVMVLGIVIIGEFIHTIGLL